jgi:hypothetical protein
VVQAVGWPNKQEEFISVAIEYRYARSDASRLPDLATDLVCRSVGRRAARAASKAQQRPNQRRPRKGRQEQQKGSDVVNWGEPIYIAL